MSLKLGLRGQNTGMLLENKRVKYLMYLLVSIILTPFHVIYMREYYIFSWSLVICNIIVIAYIIIFLIVSLWSFINFIKNVRRDILKAIIPMTINLIALIILGVMSVGYIQSLYLSPTEKFHQNRERFQQVVYLIESGKVKSTSADYPAYSGKTVIQLPLRYRNLSIGGEVWYEKNNETIYVFFITSTDVIYEKFYGYIYCNSNVDSAQEVFDGKKYLSKMESRWFWNGP